MTDALVPGCKVRHRRRVYIGSIVACVVALTVALIWTAWWSVLIVAVVFYLAAWHPVCRYANQHYGYGKET